MAERARPRGAAARRLAAVRGVVFDLDGTLVLADRNVGAHRALPGAIELLAWLRTRGLPFQVLTNGTVHTPAKLARKLRDIGLDVRNEEMMTPASAAADWFTARDMHRVLALGGEGVWGPLAEAGIEIVPSGAGGPTDVQAVFVGWFREFTLPHLEHAAHALWAGARLTSASNVPFFATADGRSIGASFAINAMLRSLTGASLTVLGKPARAALASAARRMGLARGALPSLLVVGDDPQLEMQMANACGAMSVAVTSGLNTRRTLAKLPARRRPSLVVGGAAQLLKLLQHTRRSS